MTVEFLKQNRDAIVVVRLSHRNVLALLAKIDGGPTVRRSENRAVLLIFAESDERHYGSRMPGLMRPATEAFIAEHGGNAWPDPNANANDA